MAKTKISEFSATANSNTDINSINIAEGCAPSNINDAIRELMAELKDFQAGTKGDSFNGPVGTTTAAAGAFTTLSASSTVSGTGFSTYLASPPAIGGTAPAAGAFTTLSSTGNTTLGDASGDTVTINGTATFANVNPTLSAGTANGVLYLNGSKVATSGSALTFDGTTFTAPGSIISSGANPLFQGSSATGSAALSNSTAGAYIRVYGASHATRANYTDFINGSSTSTFDSSGNLGIGTSSPSQKLEVAGNILINTSGNPYMEIKTSGAGNNPYLRLTASTTYWDVAGIFSDSTDPLQFAYGGSEKMRLDSSGNLLVGATGATSNSRLSVKGSSTSASDLNFFFVNSAGSTVLAAYNNGALYADNMKSGAGTNTVKFSTSTGQITYDTSSARYKDNIRDSIYGLSHVMQMRSAQFEYKDDGRSDVGLIAEELDLIIPELVGKNKEGQPDSVSYDRMVSVLVKAIQELKAEFDAYKATHP